MLDVAIRDLNVGENNDLMFETSVDSPATAKIFVLDENTRPQCDSKAVALA